ncbi:MAG: toxin-antitoxin system TumE family protein [Desulfobulbaceae bacterium]
MKAELMLNERLILSETAFVEMVVWHLPQPLPGSSHQLKYRLALVVEERCVLRYDNETGKGDHKHFGEVETPYIFITPELLLKDFWDDVDNWRY